MKTAVIDRFWSPERGNAAIDWLVLTAGLVALGVAVAAAFAAPDAIAAEMQQAQILSGFGA